MPTSAINRVQRVPPTEISRERLLKIVREYGQGGPAAREGRLRAVSDANELRFILGCFDTTLADATLISASGMPTAQLDAARADVEARLREVGG